MLMTALLQRHQAGSHSNRPSNHFFVSQILYPIHPWSLKWKIVEEAAHAWRFTWPPSWYLWYTVHWIWVSEEPPEFIVCFWNFWKHCILTFKSLLQLAIKWRSVGCGNNKAHVKRLLPAEESCVCVRAMPLTCQQYWTS